MKPYEQLTYLGRVWRFRQLASAALAAYGLGKAQFKLFRQAGNTLFRVVASDPTLTKAEDDLYENGQYLLRIHHPDYQSTDAIELELAWLAAMCRDANLPVPEPFPTLDGRLLAQVSIPGIRGKRNCSLLRWLKGRFLTKGIGPHHYRAQGRLMAQLHDYAAHWQPPPGLTKRRYNWKGLFRDDSGTGMPASEAWPLLPQTYQEPFEIVARRVRQVMDELGQGPDVYGLIHADLGVDANVLFWGGEARAIDFDESGFGYWVYDLAIALEHCREDAEYPEFRDALLDGYAEVRSLPEGQLEYLELFAAAFDVYWTLWAVAAAHVSPRTREGLRSRMERAARLVVSYVAGC
jgi:Ser/Thr protein kinase RdoA (MazF antagonist)